MDERNYPFAGGAVDASVASSIRGGSPRFRMGAEAGLRMAISPRRNAELHGPLRTQPGLHQVDQPAPMHRQFLRNICAVFPEDFCKYDLVLRI